MTDDPMDGFAQAAYEAYRTTLLYAREGEQAQLDALWRQVVEEAVQSGMTPSDLPLPDDLTWW